MARRVPLGGTYNIGFRAHIDAGETTPIERIPCLDESPRAAPAPWCRMAQERGRALASSATHSKWDNLRIDVHFMGHGYGVFATWIKRTRRDGAVFGGGFVPRPEAGCSGTDSYGPPLLAVVNKMNDVVDTKPLDKRSMDLAWRPAAGPWEDVEREQVGARTARGSAGLAQQLPVRDQVRPSSQTLPHAEDRGPGGLPHISVGILGHAGSGKTTLIRAFLQLLADKRPDNVVTVGQIDKAPLGREGDVLAAAPVVHYVPSMGAPRIGVFMNKCDMVDAPELLGRVEVGSAPALPEIGHDHAPGAAMLSAVGTGLPGLENITVDAPCGLRIGAAEFWTGCTHFGHIPAFVPEACEAHAFDGDTGVEPEPGGLSRDIASVTGVNTSVFNQTNNPTHNLLRQPGPLLGDLNRYIAWLVENFELLQPYVNGGARVEHAPHPPCAQRAMPGYADDLQRMMTCATRMDGARRTQPERSTPPNRMPTQPRSGDHPLPGTFFDSRRGS